MSLFWRMVATRDLRRSFGEVRHGHRYVPLGLQVFPVEELSPRATAQALAEPR